MIMKENKKIIVQLPDEVAKEYELLDWTGSPKQFFGNKLGYININNLTLKQAKRLVQANFRYLKKKEKVAAAPAKNK